tara:strand:- start:253 stop:1080 length:828 start_codon:yes stop_codon:yes gene_type:complete
MNQSSINSIPEYHDIKALVEQGRDPQRIFRVALTIYKRKLEESLILNRILKVKSGLFKGLIIKATEKSSSIFPKLQGTYEKELQNLIERNAIGVDCFLNIGCADGFYLTGIANWLKIKSIGIDIDPYFSEIINELAIINKIDSLVSYKSSINSSLRSCKGKLMVLIDVDGNEMEVINQLNSAINSMKKVSEILLFVESDFSMNGEENTSEIIKQLINSGYKINEIQKQCNAYRFNESLPEITFNNGAKLSFIDKAVLGTESRRGGQCWIMATKHI